MLSLLRLRALPVLRHSPRAQRTLPSPRTSLRSLSTTRTLYLQICLNCHREGHFRSDCKEPMICAICGVQGHKPRDCPKPDPAHIEALKTAPRKCFRCGEAGHLVQECSQPPKCFHCGQSGHISKTCPTAPPRPNKAPAATAAV